MKKSDLKTGMRMLTRNGDFHIYYKKDGKFIDSECGVVHLEDYDKEYKDETCDDNMWDIMKIFDIPVDTDYIFDYSKKGDLLWERKEETFI